VVLATEFTISAVEDRRCHAREPDGSNQSTVLASCTAVMQYVVGDQRVFRFGSIHGDGPFLIGKDLQSKAVPQRPHKQPSSEQRLEPQFMCVFDPCASMDDIGDDRRPLSVAQQAGCILAKNAHARHDVDFDFDAICGGRSCKLAMRTQQLSHVTVDITRHVVKCA
jgi:hypothetical protein